MSWQRQYAQAWATTIPDVLARTYPYAAAHVATGPQDCDVTPTRLHPSFHGCLDWHSSCHMQWSAIRLLTLATVELDDQARDGLVAVLDDRLTPEKVAVEVDYLRRHPRFERPYGWGWAAMLAAAARECPLPEARAWEATTRPLYDVVLELVSDWLPRLHYPVRSGEHANVTFGLGLVLDAGTALPSPQVEAVRELVAERARFWFGEDRDYPAAWEPGGSDFLSPALAEADLMRRVLPAEEFGRWLDAFLPSLGCAEHPLLQLPEVVDPTDGKGAHLLGLALHRAAALRSVAVALTPRERERIQTVTQGHIEATERHIVAGDFMATHWLVSFAILAATAGA
ncbi:DUF2891 family protein [Arsenicicoccus sp. oral taxon 190]|uniref:DUF2891 family protein n=1 Tax=Arsenicicoccus sp. oral taxon 190 TaxID=1658671 RepID=UPI000679FEDB|nr:DUF2891 family protein [Arsenicicoccus sp. oral taxon 190]AKT50996.1 hypothetical protein ADJ73_06095 [Arsenicicoccus sp. oral taxon 190]